MHRTLEWLCPEDPEQTEQSKKEHLARYTQILRIADLDGKAALDLGCGAGYGARELAYRAAEVTGIDRDPKAIEYAESHYGGLHLTFIQGELEEMLLLIVALDKMILPRFPQFRKWYDIVTSFEVMEHLEKPEVLPDVASRSMAKDGVFYLSVPFNNHTAKEPTVGDPFHKWVFDWKGLQDVLKPYFKQVWIGVQHMLEFLPDIGPIGTSWFVTCREPI